MKKYFKFLPLVALNAGVAAWWGYTASWAWEMTKKCNHEFEDIESLEGLPIEDVNLTTTDNLNISAWFIRHPKSSKAVIILNGRGCNRTFGLERAELYLKRGYSVLLPDLRATGRSDGDTISFGWEETKDLAACYTFMQQHNFDEIGVHGYSLGAATICYSLKRQPNYSFVVLESCYASMGSILQHIVRKYHLPFAAVFPMKFHAERIMGFKLDLLTPQAYIRYCKAPLFVMSGDSELFVSVEDTLSLYHNSASPKRQFHIFKGAEHEDFFAGYRNDYQTQINSFLNNLEAA